MGGREEGERSSGGRNAVDEVANRDRGRGRGNGKRDEVGMRNHPVKLDPKLTVLLYVLTRRGGLDRIARHLPRVSPRRRRAALVTRWRDGITRRGFGETRPRPRHPRKLYANCKQKAAVSNYFRPQATTVDNLITMAIPATTWLFGAYVHIEHCV